MDDLGERAVIARRLRQHIRCARHQNGIVVTGGKGSEAVKARWCGKEAAVVADDDILVVGDGGELPQAAAAGIGEGIAARG
jgi:hypothetical protein